MFLPHAAVFIALVGFASPAHAASFDCKTATAAFDRAICADPELGAADTALADVYNRALGRLTPEGQEDFRSAQRGWIRFVRTVCSEAASRAREEEQATCIKRAYNERQKQLDAAVYVAADGMVIGRGGLFSPVPRPVEGGGYYSGFASRDLAWPYIDGPKSEGERRWNDLVRPKVSTLDEAECEGRYGDWSADYRIAYASRTVISLVWENNSYCPGSNHGYHSASVRNRVLLENRDLVATDIFLPGSGWEDALATLTSVRLKAVPDNSFSPDQIEPDYLRKLVIEPGHWVLGADAFGIQFGLWEIGGARAGSPSIDIPWSELKPYLSARSVIQPPTL